MKEGLAAHVYEHSILLELLGKIALVLACVRISISEELCCTTRSYF